MRTKAKPTETPKERSVSLAGVILAFSLFGFLWPHGNLERKTNSDFKTQKESEALSLARDSRPAWGPISFPW